ncbi:MAG: RHS repeat-associated core domain-containing protein [Planctomycetota bacterium]
MVALSDSTGDTVQTYEYSVYGEVSASDPNHPNPYMFAGRRFDIEIGLYYNRARYYNPYIGRFLQIDPVGYEAGMNLYTYCGNNPVRFVDPSGLEPEPCPICGNPEGSCSDLYIGSDPCWAEVTGSIMTLPYQLDPRKVSVIKNLNNYLDWVTGIKGLKFKGGIALNLWQQDWAKIAGKVTNPARHMVSQYLQFMKSLTEVIPEMMNTTAWRGFFEVQIYRWKRDKDGKIVEEDGHRVKEAVDKPYWVEVINMRGHTPGGGYLNIQDAYRAAVRGRNFWYCSKLGRPEPRGWYSEDEGGGLGFYGQEFRWEGVDVPEFGY